MSSPSFSNPPRRAESSTQLRNPALELVGDERQKLYIAALERQIRMYAVRDIQLRSALEAATGRAYDTFDPRNMDYEQISAVVASDLSRGLNISIEDARSLVQENIQTANPSQMEKPNQG